MIKLTRAIVDILVVNTMGNNGDKEDGNDSYSNLDKCINKDDDDKRSNEKPMMITIAIMIKAIAADDNFYTCRNICSS